MGRHRSIVKSFRSIARRFGRSSESRWWRSEVEFQDANLHHAQRRQKTLGNAQEDVLPVSQFEKLWGDMSGLLDVSTNFFVVPLQRGKQLKEQAQLDGWLRDGTADYVNRFCQWS